MEHLKNKLAELKIRTTKHTLPIDSAYLDKLEQALSVKLPESYTWFLKTYSMSLIPMASCHSKGKEIGAIERFHGASSRSAYDDLIYFYTKYIPTHEISVNFLPIGEDPGGNQVFLVLKGGNAGKVYFWDHETGETLWMADSFEEFILNLKTCN